ncbi:MAG: CCE_0567 family metalloprotein [Methylobacter sp.]
MLNFPNAHILESEALHYALIQRAKQKREYTIVAETTVIEQDDIKAKLKKLNAQATALKMDLHDLAEDLPTGWERIREVAEKTYQAHLDLNEVRKQIAETGR